MSSSIHTNGHAMSDGKFGIQHHINRETEKDGIEANRYTTSLINPKNTHLNRLLERPQTNVMSDMRKQLKEINVKRKEKGMRVVQNNKHTFSIISVQLSLDALEKLGYDDSLTDGNGMVDFSKQSERCKENIYNAYTMHYQTVKQRKDIELGEVVLASIHVDESIPHLDIVTNTLDSEKLDAFANLYNNGESGFKKKHDNKSKGSFLQDDLERGLLNYMTIETRDKFLLNRGTSIEEQKTKHMALNKRERIISKQEKNNIDFLNGIIEAQKLNDKKEFETEEKAELLLQKEKEVEEKENQIYQREKEIEQKEKKLDEDSNDFGEYKIQQQENFKAIETNINSRLSHLEKYEKEKNEWVSDWEKKYLERFARDSKNNFTAEDAEKRLDAIQNVEEARAMHPQKQQSAFVDGRDSLQQME